MPEGPELHLSSQFINAVCKGRIFSGKIRRNPIHKCADVLWDATAYTITAASRGKELKVFLQSLKTDPDEKPQTEKSTLSIPGKVHTNSLHILFNFGMSGKFEFTAASELPKHAHLTFYTKSEPLMALSFVDYRRFGKWQEGADWSADRGPCVLFEYPQFRANVLNNLSDSAFNKPVCEVLLNQKYFNGIGNYLRAEICYRGGIRPFDQARAVFASLPDVPDDVKVKTEEETKQTVKFQAKTEDGDILQLCNTIPLEVVGLGTSLYLPEDDHSDMSKFSLWLQCYYKPSMKNIADHNKRTMWYHGDPGPMLPREAGSRKRHAVYDKKLTKNGKKIKKETSKEETHNSKEKERQSKSKKQERAPSPAKTKRITRTSLKTLPDKEEVEKKPRKQTKSKRNSTDKTDRLAKKPVRKQSVKKDLEAMDDVVMKKTKDVKVAGKKRATRMSVKAS